MARTEKARCQEACSWMQANYGEGILVSLTGTDWRAFKALVHAWDVWTYTRSKDALDACVGLLRCMQVDTRDLGVALIPFAADWSDEVKMRERLSASIDGVSIAPMERAP